MKIYFVSLGCDKNLVDSEHMLSELQEDYEIVDSIEECDIAIVNTCAFIKDAKEESINTILSLAEQKNNNIKKLVITGCLAQRYYKDLTDLIPEIDGYIGISALNNIKEDMKKIIEGEKLYDLPDINEKQHASAKRYINPPFHTSYLKIAEGCDKRCTYCAIPQFRGTYRSIPMNRLVKTARELVSDGVRELILVAQETTVYGTDLYGEKKLPELLHRLAEIEELQWIRLLYCYPEEITDELIETIAVEPKVLSYIDMPLQHTEDHVLQRMGRRLTKEGLKNLVRRLRDRIPDIVLRTTLIAGFPGETEEEHQALMETLDELEFDRVGVFPYSKEEGTIAAEMPDQIDPEVKERYRDEIMELQQEISFDKNEALVGSNMDVLIEGYLPEEDVYVARTYRDAPDVDGLVFVSADRELISGEILHARITGAAEYDLTAEIL